MKIYKHIVSDVNNYFANFYAFTRASRVSSVLFMKKVLFMSSAEEK